MSELEKKTVAELKEHAEEHGVDLTGVTKKADIIAAIEAATADVPAEPAATEADEAPEVVEEVETTYQAKQKPELDADAKAALAAREAKQRKNPAFRRQEWFRYKKLGGKTAPWRRPRGIHSKMRRHYKYRPPVVRIGYRTPTEARGLHPSGFEEILVYRPEDLEGVDAKLQAVRVGGTVGGRKAALIEAKADEMGIRVLNRRNA